MITDDHFYAIIMAGGGGTRLWPVSRRKRPKQMLNLLREESLFLMCISNLEGVIPPERILVVTAVDQAGQLQQQAPQIPRVNFILEPQPRGNAAAVGLASVFLQRRDAAAVTAILAADIIFQNVEGYRSLLRSAFMAAQAGYLVTLGIEPTYPATGYGYIERGERIPLNLPHAVNSVNKFKEKPNLELAKRMMADGRHVWNSGLFIWRVAQVLGEYQRNMPELWQILQTILAKCAGDAPIPEAISADWEKIQPQTIDFGIMEKAQKVAVLSASGLGWNDIGCWDSLYEVLPADENGNIRRGEHILLDHSRRTLVFSENHRPILAVGLEDTIIIDGEEALLICQRDESQQVKEVVKILKDSGRERYL
mgnify:CR=1 FL=1